MATVVFIHGLWLARDSWQPWLELFRAQGYDAEAYGWPGEADSIAETRARPEAQAGVGLTDIADHYGKYLPSGASGPIVVGHSFGGLIAQILLSRGLVAGAAVLSPAPVKGVRKLPVAQLRSALPVLGNPRNRGRAKALSRRQFRYGFGNTMSRSESDALWAKWSIPSPGRPLFEVASANKDADSAAAVDTRNGSRGPLLMVAAGRDHTVPGVTTRAAYDLYSGSGAVTQLHEFESKGHSLTIDAGWREVADDVLGWLRGNQLGPDR